MNGSTSETTTPLVPASSACAWAARALACCASRSASSANWVGFMARSPNKILPLPLREGGGRGPRTSYYPLPPTPSRKGRGRKLRLVRSCLRSLRGQEVRMHNTAGAGQHDAFHDVVVVGQIRRLRVLVPERAEEGQQVARIERRGRNRNAPGPVAVAQDRNTIRRDDALARHCCSTIAARVGGD